MASVLIVDDDLDIASAVADLLQDAGHFVRTAESGEAGLRALRAAALPDCVVLDVDMPVLSGPQMAHRMLLHDAGEELVPVLLISARPDLPEIAARMGTPYFIAKPAGTQSLLDLLDRALRERIAPASASNVEPAAVETADRASASSRRRDATDRSLREERDKVDATRMKQQAAIDRDADEVVELARRDADAVLLKARQDEAETRERQLVTAESQADSLREARAADVATRSERAADDRVRRKERTDNQKLLDDFLRAERALTGLSLADERLHASAEVNSRDEFLGMVSHDLRNLLGAVDLKVSALATATAVGQPGANATTRTCVAAILSMTGRMNRLIGDLLDVASIEAGKLGVSRAPGDARRVARETIEAFAEIARSKGVELQLGEGMDEGEALEAWIDPGRIAQVLANLLSNAIKFTPAGGRIIARVARVKDEVQFCVEDNGAGIPEESLTVIFERYRQIQADRRGLGVGLYISKCIAEAHGGRIWAESRFGEGSAFYLAIPLHAPQ